MLLRSKILDLIRIRTFVPISYYSSVLQHTKKSSSFNNQSDFDLIFPINFDTEFRWFVNCLKTIWKFYFWIYRIAIYSKSRDTSWRLEITAVCNFIKSSFLIHFLVRHNCATTRLIIRFLRSWWELFILHFFRIAIFARSLLLFFFVCRASNTRATISI